MREREGERKFDDDVYSMASYVHREEEESSKISIGRKNIANATKITVSFFFLLVCNNRQ
jgi:hypothetical protein